MILLIIKYEKIEKLSWLFMIPARLFIYDVFFLFIGSVSIYTSQPVR